MHAKFFHAGMKGPRILLCDNTGCGVVMLWPTRFQNCSPDINQTPLYLHMQLTTCILNSNYRWTYWCILLHKSGSVQDRIFIPINLLYEERSISSGNSVILTSKRSCTSFKILASPSSLTSVIARPWNTPIIVNLLYKMHKVHVIQQLKAVYHATLVTRHSTYFTFIYPFYGSYPRQPNEKWQRYIFCLNTTN